MKLHEAESPNAKRVHVFMAEKGIDLPRVVVPATQPPPDSHVQATLSIPENAA